MYLLYLLYLFIYIACVSSEIWVGFDRGSSYVLALIVLRISIYIYLIRLLFCLHLS